MILDNPAAIQAALATINPVARNATQILALMLIHNPNLLSDKEEISRSACAACVIAFQDNIGPVESHAGKFEQFLEDNGANVLDLAVSIILFLANQDQSQRRWGTVGKIAALVGAAALGAFFG